MEKDNKNRIFLGKLYTTRNFFLKKYSQNQICVTDGKTVGNIQTEVVDFPYFIIYSNDSMHLSYLTHQLKSESELFNEGVKKVHRFLFVF